MNPKCKGVIKINRDFLFDPDMKKILKELFSRFIPVHIDHYFDIYIYSGFCDEFKEIEEGKVIPEYRASISQDGDNLKLSFFIQ